MSSSYKEMVYRLQGDKLNIPGSNLVVASRVSLEKDWEAERERNRNSKSTSTTSDKEVEIRNSIIRPVK